MVLHRAVSHTQNVKCCGAVLILGYIDTENRVSDARGEPYNLHLTFCVWETARCSTSADLLPGSLSILIPFVRVLLTSRWASRAVSVLLQQLGTYLPQRYCHPETLPPCSPVPPFYVFMLLRMEKGVMFPPFLYFLEIKT